MSGTSDSLGGTPIVAMSKGVIQREHQRTATVFGKNLFQPPNPFNRMTEDDIEEYKSNIEKRVRNGSGTELTVYTLDAMGLFCIGSSHSMYRHLHVDGTCRVLLLSANSGMQC